jgi:hypothetical protein
VTYPATLWCQFQRAVDTGGAERLLTLTDGSANNRFGLEITTADVFGAFTTGSGASDGSAATVGALAVGTTYKGVASLATNDLAAVRDGGSEAQDTGLTLPATPTTIHVGTQVSAANPCFGYIEKFAIVQGYKTTAERQAMTS